MFVSKHIRLLCALNEQSANKASLLIMYDSPKVRRSANRNRKYLYSVGWSVNTVIALLLTAAALLSLSMNNFTIGTTAKG